MEEYIKTISVPAIAAAVYFVMKLIRHAAGGNKKFERFIPLISAGLGVIFGVVCFFALPAIIPADSREKSEHHQALKPSFLPVAANLCLKYGKVRLRKSLPQLPEKYGFKVRSI